MRKSVAVLFFAVSTLCFYFSFGQSNVHPDPLAAHIDSTEKPGDDFFLYANGKWFKENPIPASEQNNGYGN